MGLFYALRIASGTRQVSHYHETLIRLVVLRPHLGCIWVDLAQETYKDAIRTHQHTGAMMVELNDQMRSESEKTGTKVSWFALRHFWNFGLC